MIVLFRSLYFLKTSITSIRYSGTTEQGTVKVFQNHLDKIFKTPSRLQI